MAPRPVPRTAYRVCRIPVLGVRNCSFARLKENENVPRFDTLDGAAGATT